MKLSTATTVLAIFIASVPFSTAEPILESTDTVNIFILAIADAISLQGVALPSALSALAHFSAAASRRLGAMDLLVLQAKQPVNELELRGDGVRVGVHFGGAASEGGVEVEVEVVKNESNHLSSQLVPGLKEKISSQEFQATL
jgi:hypothetical protein